MKAILGKKIGMTQIFSPEGKAIPVTVIEAGPCTVIQTKTTDIQQRFQRGILLNISLVLPELLRNDLSEV